MPEFYLLYLIHFLISLGGLMTLGNLSEIARSLHVQNATIFGISIVAFAATANGISSTASRIIWGTASDRIGRENTMTIVFLIEAVCIFAVTLIAGNPILFVVIFPLVFFGYGQINTLLSATTGDLFGSRYASTIFGMVYTGKGAAALFSGWGAAALAAAFAGSFVAPYYIAAACDVLAAVLAFFLLKPIARNTLARSAQRRDVAQRLDRSPHKHSRKLETKLMKITKVETHLVSAPLAHSWETGIGSAKQRDELLVLVHTDEGITGIGSSYHAHAGLAMKAVVDTKVAPAVIGLNPLDIGAIWERLFYGTVYIGSAGVQGLAGIDIALWDILGKVSKQPVATLLGGGGVDYVMAYVGCMSLGFKAHDKLVEEAQGYVSRRLQGAQDSWRRRGQAGRRRDARRA